MRKWMWYTLIVAVVCGLFAPTVVANGDDLAKHHTEGCAAPAPE